MNFIVHILCTVCILCASVVKVPVTTHATVLTLVNNSYSGLLVAIHPDVPEDEQLITSIKAMLNEASNYLYVATGQRAYFGDVTILVPDTWTSNSTWAPSTSQLFSNADIVIKDNKAPPSPSTHTTPIPGAYTQSYDRCGQPGARIVLFTSLFGANGTMAYGPNGRLLVHEWAHYRWGVFNEHAEEGEPQFYFSPTTLNLEGVKCNIHLAGTATRQNFTTGYSEPCEIIDNVTGLFDQSCVFSPSISDHTNHNITASIMDNQMIPSINQFCNDDQTDKSRVHNYESPSRHNRLCGSRSVWSVVSESTDFHGGMNPPRNVKYTAPFIRVVRAPRVRRIVLAIDTSASMQEHNKLTRAIQAATYFIEDGLKEGVFLGVVSFSTVAKVVSPITELTDDASRQAITRNLPTKTDGQTSIGAALLTSIELYLQLLRTHDQSAQDVFIVLITDGHETTAPTIDDVQHTISSTGAVISVISFEDEQDRSLEKLAALTGGRFYLDTRQDMSTSAVNAMLSVYRFFDSDYGQLPVQVVVQSRKLAHYETMAGSFILDSSLGKDTRAIITYTSKEAPDITITSPSGRRYNHLYPEYANDPILKRAKITVPALAEIGYWSFAITNNNQDRRSVIVSIVVLSSGRDYNFPALMFNGDIFVENSSWPIRSIIVAEVMRSDVLSRDLQVRATVDRPMASPATLELFDNGAGADAVKGDGIYSRFFTMFSTSGHYSVSIEMMAASGDVIVSGGVQSAPSQIATGYASGVHIEHQAFPFGEFRNDSTVVDEYPPMRITDLRVLHTSHRNKTVVLAWTAPGDDMDYDKASSYTIIMSQSAEAIVNGQNISVLDASCVIKGTLHSPKPFGETEQVTLQLKMFKGSNASMVFAIFAVDDSENQAELSNLVTAGFGYVPDLSTQEFNLETTTDGNEDAKVAPKSQKVVIACVVGLAAGLLVATITVTLIIQCVDKRKKEKVILYRFEPSDTDKEHMV